jgi:(2Fe-2S) ferredoxin
VPGARTRLRGAAEALARRLGVPVIAAHATAAAGEPTLIDAVERLVAGGHREIAVVPFETEWPGHTAYDVPDLLWDVAEQRPDLRLRLGRPLALVEATGEALAQSAAGAWQQPPSRRAAAGGSATGAATVREVAELAGQTPVTSARLDASTMPRLPAHRQHVFVCFGRRCMELGATETFEALTRHLAAHERDRGPERVKVTRSKCLSPCAAAPVACVYPQGTFVARLEPAGVAQFVEDVLVGAGDWPGHTFVPGE